VGARTRRTRIVLVHLRRVTTFVSKGLGKPFSSTSPPQTEASFPTHKSFRFARPVSAAKPVSRVSVFEIFGGTQSSRRFRRPAIEVVRNSTWSSQSFFLLNRVVDMVDEILHGCPAWLAESGVEFCRVTKKGEKEQPCCSPARRWVRWGPVRVKSRLVLVPRGCGGAAVPFLYRTWLRGVGPGSPPRPRTSQQILNTNHTQTNNTPAPCPL